MSELRKHLETLPQELYELIMDFTFTPDPCAYRIDQHFRPSNVQQVDRLSRRLVMNRLYHDDAVFYCTNHEHCTRWLGSLEQATLFMLREVRCESVVDLWQLGSAEYVAKMQQLRIVSQLLRLGVVLDASVLYFRAVEEDGTAWWTNKI